MGDASVRFGILGTGNMADTFARSLRDADDVRLVAVASRTQESADRFGAARHVDKCYASYEALADDPDIDIVYIATPHSRHKEDCLMCLDAGKAVLCEKPFAINAEEAAAVIERARERRLFLMEAMWTRFLPSMVRLRDLLHDGIVGPVRMIIAGGAFQPERGTDHYLWNLELGGGVMLDAGIYPLSLTSMILGKPQRVAASGHVGEFDVDEQDAVLLGYDDGATAMLYVSLQTSRPPDMTILGTHGKIVVNAPLFAACRLDLQRFGKGVEMLEFPIRGSGYHYQAIAAAQAIRNGTTESPVMPLDETLAIMQTLDQVRAEVGMRYPSEM